VGTVHGDPEGYARAWRLLTHFRPQAVGVEISPFSVRYREHHGPRWQRLLEEVLAALPPEAANHLAVRRLMAQAAMPFEWQVAADYGRTFGVQVQAVDWGAPARCHLPAYAREVLVPENVRALLTTPDGSLREFVTQAFRRARFAAIRPLSLPAGGSSQESARREGHMARRLRQWVAAGCRVVHLGGWEHLAPRLTGGSLFDRLADLQPVRMLLDEADYLPGRSGA
jgi:hypothetical protein